MDKLGAPQNCPKSRLIQVGAEVCKDYFGDKIRLARDGMWVIYVEDGAWEHFNPVHDPRHTEMVLDEMCKKGWRIFIEYYAYHIEVMIRKDVEYLTDEFEAEAPLSDKGRAIMDACKLAIRHEACSSCKLAPMGSHCVDCKHCDLEKY